MTHAAQFSVSHTRLPSWLQVLQCAGWLKVLASCHSCASLLHCAVAWQMMSSELQAAQTGVARAARFGDLQLDRLAIAAVRRTTVLRDPVLMISNGFISLTRRSMVCIHSASSGFASCKLANRPGHSIAKLRNTHVLNVIVTSGTQKRLLAGKARH